MYVTRVVLSLSHVFGESLEQQTVRLGSAFRHRCALYFHSISNVTCVLRLRFGVSSVLIVTDLVIFANRLISEPWPPKRLAHNVIDQGPRNGKALDDSGFSASGPQAHS
jgi:hypothetical protein